MIRIFPKMETNLNEIRKIKKKTRNLFVKYYFSYVGREAVRDCFWNSGGSGKKKTKYVSGLAFMRHTAGERI